MPTLIKRYEGFDHFDLDNGKKQFVSAVNIRDFDTGVLNPLEQDIVTDGVNYPDKVKYANAKVKFGDNGDANKYARYLESKDGETIKITLKTLTCDNKTKNSKSMKWGSGAITFETITDEKCVKEIVNQPSGQAITYVYDITGLDVDHTGGVVHFTKTVNGIKRPVFKVERPFYVRPVDPAYFDFTWVEIVAGSKYELTLPAPAQDEIVDPTITLGQSTRSGMKDAQLRENSPDFTIARDNRLFLRHPQASANEAANVGRVDIPQIPAGSTIDSATFTVTLFTNGLTGSNTFSMSLRECLTANGRGDDIEDTDNNPGPPTDGSASWNNAKNVDGGAGDTEWGNGTNFSSSDFGAEIDAKTASNSDSIGTQYAFNAKTLIENWLTTNNGWVLVISTDPGHNEFVFLDSMNGTTESERPKWNITYTEPVGNITNVFSARSGSDVTTGHRDVNLDESSADSANGQTVQINISDSGGDSSIGLFSFNVVGTIPASGIQLNGAFLKLKLKTNNLTAGRVFEIALRKMLVDWGQGRTTDDTPNENPATQGQATFDKAKDTNGGGGEAGWTGANFVAGTDTGAILKQITILDTDAVGTEYIINVPNSLITDMVALNDGFALTPEPVILSADDVEFHSQQSATATTDAPELTVYHEVSNVAPSIVIDSVVQRTDGSKKVDITFTGTDADNDLNSIVLSEFSIDGGTTFNPMTFATSDTLHAGTTGLLFASTGTQHVLVWDAIIDVPIGTNITNALIRLQADDGN